MSEPMNQTPNVDDAELSPEELEDVAGGLDTNNGCTVNNNCTIKPTD